MKADNTAITQATLIIEEVGKLKDGLLTFELEIRDGLIVYQEITSDLELVYDDTATSSNT